MLPNTGAASPVAVKRRKKTASAAAAAPSSSKSTAKSKPPAKTSKKKPANGSAAAAAGDAADNSSIRTVVLKGKAPVDSLCELKIGKAHVYFEGAIIYDAMLNQTNLQRNNNKFYLIQLLEDDGPKKNYSVWMRWGRVGNNGQKKLDECGADLDRAKTTFEQKFFDKTKNHWCDYDGFEKVPGKYDLLKVDYNLEDVEALSSAKHKSSEVKIPECKLDPRVKALIELICDVKAMEDAVFEMKYDARKAPLGKLTIEQIRAGYEALRDIDDAIHSEAGRSELVEACNRFYTRIPHVFGMKTPPLITTPAEIRLKLQLLEALGDIQVAMKMLSESRNDDEHPADSHYKGLDCDLKPIDRNSSDFKMIEDYLLNSHEKTHNTYKMAVTDAYECEKKGEAKKFVDVGQRMLLWHGSRLTNWAGILKQGLRIAPPEAPCTGYMFGKGVYFADRSSKSANYCYTSRTNNTGLLVLCEVSLGTCHELINCDYEAHRLPRDRHSVKGLGQSVPDHTKNVTLDDGTIVPIGPSHAAKNALPLSLNYNEYVIYDTKQIKMRYLVQVKFTHK